MKVVEETQTVRVMQSPWSIESAIKDVLASGTQEDAFNLMDLGEVVARYQQWKELMPRVEPFYAVKCNDDKLLVSTLAALGSSFDCASKGEIELVTSLGVARELVIRIRCDAEAAQCPLGIKFGCDPLTDAPRLIKLAAVLGLEIIGVSFHCGSGADEPAVYARGIAHCRELFHIGTEAGHHMRLVDLGGGFPGNKDTSIVEEARVINSALEEHFPEREVRVIAEPGRYFAAAAYTLAALVYGMKDVPSKQRPGETHTMYYMNDGTFGSFSDVISYHVVVEPVPLNPSGLPPNECSLWGPTGDGLDCVVPRTNLPPMTLGDWIMFHNLGAYSLVLATKFNGIPIPGVKAVIDIKFWSILRELPLSNVNFTFDFEPQNQSELGSEPGSEASSKAGDVVNNEATESSSCSQTDSSCHGGSEAGSDCSEDGIDYIEAGSDCSKAGKVLPDVYVF